MPWPIFVWENWRLSVRPSSHFFWRWLGIRPGGNETQDWSKMTNFGFLLGLALICYPDKIRTLSSRETCLKYDVGEKHLNSNSLIQKHNPGRRKSPFLKRHNRRYPFCHCCCVCVPFGGNCHMLLKSCNASNLEAKLRQVSMVIRYQ